MKTLLVTLAGSLALTSCLAANGTAGTTGGNGICQSAGESCASSADCCSGFSCSGTTCVFTGGNGNNNGSGSSTGASTGAASTGASSTSGNGTSAGSTGATGSTGTTHSTTGQSTGATTGHSETTGGTGSSAAATTGGNGSSSFATTGGNGSSSFGTTGGNGSSSFGTTGGNGSSSFGTTGGNGSSSFGTTGGNGSSSFGTTGGNGSSSFGTTGGSGSSSLGTTGGSTGSVGNLTPQPLMSGGWPKWQADLANSGRSEADTSRLDGGISWTYSVGAAGTSLITEGPDTYANSPVVASDGTIYQVTMAGALVALSPTGTQLWSVQLTDTSGDPYPSTPAIRADGSLVVLTGSDYANATAVTQQLFIVSSAGVVLYSESYGEDGFDSPPTITGDGTLLLSDDDGSGATTDLYSAVAYTVQNGNLGLFAGANFAFASTGQSERYSVALTSETSYWGDNGQYFALTSPTAGFAVAAPWPAAGVTVSNGNADAANMFGVSNSSVAIDPATGDVIAYTGWEDGEAIFGTAPYSVLGSLTAMDPSTGAIKWSLALPTTDLPATWVNYLESDSGNAAPAFAADGTVYVGAGNGLLAVNGSTGAVNWTFSSANVSSSIAVGGDGTIFFGCDDGSFYAVTAAGALRFKIATGATISSGPAIGPEGNVYFVSDNGNLYAIH